MRTRFVLSLACAAVLAHVPAFAAEWQAGFAAAKITPEVPVAMAGYTARNHPSEGVVSDLYAKVLALVDSNGQRAVWITTDLIGLRASVAEPICERIMRRTGLARHQLLINSSHTHTGPAIAESDVSSYGISAESIARMRAYRELLQERIVSAVEQARGRPVDKRTDIWAFGCVLYEMPVPVARECRAGLDSSRIHDSAEIERNVPRLGERTEDRALSSAILR